MATSEVTVIQCTGSKRDEPSMAKDLYDESAYFRKMRAWAVARGDPWFILSAKHGLTPPEMELDPYDERGLDAEQARDIAAALSSHGADVVHICAGRDYTNHLVAELERRGIDAVNHFAGERIGTRMKLLGEATEDMEADP